MAIYINFTNKSLDYYSKDSDELNKVKNISNNLIVQSNDEYQQDLEVENYENIDENIDNNENVEELEFSENNDDSSNSLKSEMILNFEEKDSCVLKLDRLENLNMEDFSGAFLNKEIDLPAEFFQVIKLNKQDLILPDEIISFDYVIIPNLGFFKAKQSLNLKLSIDYKDYAKYGKNYKVIRKNKQNCIYSLQLAKQETSKRFINYFSNEGVKLKSVNFYSGALTDFYSSHIRGCKNASIVVKISQTKTTIIGIVHGFVVCCETLHCGESDIIRNSTYKFDEYSRKSISHKFVCYSVSQISENSSNKKITRDLIEKSYSKNKTNPLAGSFQYRSINICDLIRKKIDDMIMFIGKSDFQTKIENIFVDVKNDETFAKLKISNATKVYYPESEIFKQQKSNLIFKSNNPLAEKIKWKSFFGGSLWSKNKKV